MRTGSPPGRLIDVGGHRLHLDCRGAGDPPVVFDAALGGSSFSWFFVLPQVAAFTAACAYDRAGFGSSDAGPLPRTTGRVVDELRTLLAAASVRPPHVIVGHSFGGLAARLFAWRHPAEVAGLVLLDPAYPEDWRDPSPRRRERLARGARLCRYGERAARWRVAHAVVALAQAGARPLARRITRAAAAGALHQADEQLLAPLLRLPPDVRILAVRPWTRPSFFQALGSQIASMPVSATEVPVDQDFGSLPLVVISGETNSDAAQLARQARLAARSTRGRHIVAEGSGHWIPLDRPDVVVDAVREVVDAARERAAEGAISTR